MDIAETIGHQRHRECERKVRYPKPRLAEIAAERAERKAGKPMRTYACIWCKGWHITSKPL